MENKNHKITGWRRWVFLVSIGANVLVIGLVLALALKTTAYHHKRLTDKQAKFVQMDANGDGIITLPELMSQATPLIRHEFDRLDANGDGQITIKELGRKGKGKGRGKGKNH